VIDDSSSIGAAKRAGLVYVRAASDGIRRMRHEGDFIYVYPDNSRVTDKAELERIGRVAIPPAYEDVWICPNARGHLQATGRDARGRKQYRYHANWRNTRSDAKFGRMMAFGAALPSLRKRLKRDLSLDGLPRDKVLAIVVSILDATRVRIGNKEYARDNASYGLTTLRNRHVQFIRGDRFVLKFRGKGGLDHEIPIADRQLARLVRRCHELPGQQLFQYVDDEGGRKAIDSDQVNEYLQAVMGDEFTAKDFRTWGATLRAIVILHRTPLPEPRSERALAACIADAVKQVANDLRNTPAVCRKSYINPQVFDAWRSGVLGALISAPLPNDPRKAERFVLRFLRQCGPPKIKFSGRIETREAAIGPRAGAKPAVVQATM
jgi:DNA topoisomerase I